MSVGNFKIDIDMDGFKEALGDAKRAAKYEMRNTMKLVGDRVKEEAKRNCPREGWPLTKYRTPPERRRVSRALNRSIRYKVESYKKVRILAGGTGKVNYAKWVHGGAMGVPPRPFLTKGVELSMRDIKVLIKRAAVNIMSHVS